MQPHFQENTAHITCSDICT